MIFKHLAMPVLNGITRKNIFAIFPHFFGRFGPGLWIWKQRIAISSIPAPGSVLAGPNAVKNAFLSGKNAVSVIHHSEAPGTSLLASVGPVRVRSWDTRP
jgi:hypothetical protein